MKTDPIQAAIEAERARHFSAGRPAPRSRADALHNLREEMAQALAYEHGGPEPEGDAIRFVGMSLREMVTSLQRLKGETYPTWEEARSRAQTSGDLAAVLGGAGQRKLMKEWESIQGLMRAAGLLPTRDLRDAKTIVVDADGLEPTTEAGAFASGKLVAAQETLKIGTFGRVWGFYEPVRTNDDVGLFLQLPAVLARVAAEHAAQQLADQVNNATTTLMADGNAVISSAHSNVGTGAAFSEAGVGGLLALVRAQTGPGGEKISAIPRFLIVPPAHELAAKKVVWALGPAGGLEVLVENRLSSATAFFVAADPASAPGLAYSYGGGTGPRMEIGTEPGHVGFSVKLVLDFGCGFVDHRGWARNAGA